MFIPDPRSWFLPMPDPGSKNSNKREGWKKFFCHKFLCSHKFHNIANYFSFEVLKKKIWANFQKIYRTFYPKTVTKLSKKIWIWDLGSGKNLFRIPDQGVKKAPDPGSRIRNTAFYPKNVIKLSKIRPWDPGSEIRKKTIPDLESRGQKGTGSWIRNTVRK